jgi:hypothetical protein
VDRLRLAAIWNGGSEPVRIETAFEGGGTRLALAGPVEPTAAGWRYTASGEGLQLGPTAERPAATGIDRADLTLGLASTQDRIEIERLALRGPETDLSLVGSVTLAAEGPAVSGTVRAGAMPIPALLRYWPPFVASPARSFFAGSMNRGKVLRYEGSADLPPAALAAALRQEALPAEAVRFEASVEDAVLLPGHGMPPLSGAVIEARGDAVSAEGRLSRGEVALRSGRVLQLSEGAFTLTGLETFRPSGRFRFRAQGPFEAAVEFAETPAIRSHAPLPFESAEVRGRFDGQIGLTLPLVEKLELKDVALDMTASITSATIGEVFGKDSLEQTSLVVRVDRTGMSSKGEGRWSGTPVQIEVKARAGQTAEAVLSMTLDDQARERRGLRLGKELTGPVPVRIVADASAGEGLSARVEADLSRAAIDGLMPGLQKAAGRPARLSLQVEQRKTGYELGNILFEAGPTLLRGSAELAPDGSVIAARFPQFRLSPGDNARVEFDRAGAAGGRIVVRGQNLDARPFLRKAQQAGPPSGPDGGEVDINVKSTLLSGFGGEILTNAEVKLKRRAGRLREATVTGRFGSSAVNIRSEDGAEGPTRVILDVRDAGAFLRFLDVYGRMDGGRMVGDLYPSPRGFGAVVNIRDFVLRNEPAIRRLVAEAPQGAADPRAGTAAFTKLRAELDRIGPETRLKEAVIFGPQFGLTLQGTTDAARDRISMSGTFVPAYGLNNVFAQVPLVGTILGGGRNEGLLGLTFSLTGRASQPTVQVNPLSAITPGIFRRIFEFPNDARERVPDAMLYREQGRSGAN